jgi:hypothetical protein
MSDDKTPNRAASDEDESTPSKAAEGGEDEGSTANEGKDDHLKEDQKPITH